MSDETYTIELTENQVNRMLAIYGVAVLHEDDPQAMKGILTSLYELVKQLGFEDPADMVDSPFIRNFSCVATAAIAKTQRLGLLSDEEMEEARQDAVEYAKKEQTDGFDAAIKLFSKEDPS